MLNEKLDEGSFKVPTLADPMRSCHIALVVSHKKTMGSVTAIFFPRFILCTLFSFLLIYGGLGFWGLGLGFWGWGFQLMGFKACGVGSSGFFEVGALSV